MPAHEVYVAATAARWGASAFQRNDSGHAIMPQTYDGACTHPVAGLLMAATAAVAGIGESKDALRFVTSEAWFARVIKGGALPTNIDPQVERAFRLAMSPYAKRSKRMWVQVIPPSSCLRAWRSVAATAGIHPPTLAPQDVHVEITLGSAQSGNHYGWAYIMRALAGDNVLKEQEGCGAFQDAGKRYARINRQEPDKTVFVTPLPTLRALVEAVGHLQSEGRCVLVINSEREVQRTLEGDALVMHDPFRWGDVITRLDQQWVEFHSSQNVVGGEALAERADMLANASMNTALAEDMPEPKSEDFEFAF